MRVQNRDGLRDIEKKELAGFSSLDVKDKRSEVFLKLQRSKA